MGTEVLQPQDCLNQRLGVVVSPAIFPRRKSFYGNPRINKRQSFRPSPDRSPAISGDLKSTKNNNLVLGHVTILRRGESLDSKLKSVKNGAPVLSGPDPEMVPEQIRKCSPAAMYAGSAFSMSPSPSSLPVPSFSKKKEISPIVVDSATRDLRRLLRLD